MKKNILSLIIVLAVCTAANAQSVIYGGFKASANYSFYNKKLDGPAGTVNQRSGIGYGIGYFEVIELSNRINLQAELNFTSLAFSQKDTTDLDDRSRAAFRKETRRFSNLELPLMIKYRLTDKLALGVGYQFNLLNSRFRKGKLNVVDTDFSGEDTKTSTDLTSEEVPSTEGIIVDLSYKSNKFFGGLRVLSANDPLSTVSYIRNNNFSEVERKANLNVSLYVGLTIFK